MQQTDRTMLAASLLTGVVSLIGLVALSIFFFNILNRNRKKRPLAAASTCEGEDDGGRLVDLALDNEFDKGTGPKRFTYQELDSATNNFLEGGWFIEGSEGSQHGRGHKKRIQYLKTGEKGVRFGGEQKSSAAYRLVPSARKVTPQWQLQFTSVL